ncbi:MAG: NAD(P)H-dependent oxidoreductase [Gammaproteobacteria bacterium]|nr:NAD(P)H-dependent oxidoreductase [Gammaproteobacteria bacterium]
MTTSPRLLAFAGSLRKDSFNRKLIQTLAEGAREAGAKVTLLELRDHALPLYDGDIEAAGMPNAVRTLQSMMAEHDGLLIATPEYNGAYPALIKNTLDWISRPLDDGKAGTTLFAGKIAGLCSASPGGLGGLRALLTLRDALAKLGMWVAPSQVAVGRAGEVFDDQGNLTDERQRSAVQRVGAEVTTATRRMRLQ